MTTGKYWGFIIVKKLRKKSVKVYGLTFLWVMAISTGLFSFYNYEFTSGLQGEISKLWPADTHIERTATYQLIMFVHPQCPCTKASIHELAYIMDNTDGKLLANVVFIKPSMFDNEWTKTETWYSANSITNVKSLIDDEGREARIFGATTSGQTFLYDQEGNLLFSGGITESRGHIGNNPGRSTVLSFVQEGTGETDCTPFFGCPLFYESEPQP